MTNDDTAWIAERAKCDMAALAADVNVLVKYNVEAMNTICKTKGRPSFQYIPVRAHPLTFAVEQHLPPRSRSCAFEYNDQALAFTVTMREPNRIYTMQTRWDGETAQCRVVVNQTSSDEQSTTEFPHDQLGKAMSSILEPFFFPSR